MSQSSSLCGRETRARSFSPPPPSSMGLESCAYVATENVGVAFAHRARNACLFLMFAGFLALGIVLVSAFPSAGCEPPALSEQAIGLSALLFVAACCACTQGLCYVFDEKSRVSRTSTQEEGDVPSESAPRGAEVYAAIDIGEKACSTLSSCWQVCVFSVLLWHWRVASIAAAPSERYCRRCQRWGCE